MLQRTIALAWTLFLSGCAPVFHVDRTPLPKLEPIQFPERPDPGDGPPLPLEPPTEVSPPDSGWQPSLDDAEQAIRIFQQRRNGDETTADVAWAPFLESIDAYLHQAPERLSLSPLIRARVTAEFELDQERRRPGGADSDLERVLTTLIQRIDHKVRALHTLATAADRSAPEGSGFLSWPLSHGMIASGYGYRRDPLNRQMRFHGGLDLAAAPRDPVYAAAAGTVVRSGWAGNAGWAVRIRHNDRAETVYAHLALALVHHGQELAAGDVIGLVGDSGRSTGPHLHFALYLEGHAADPIDHLGPVSMSFSDLTPGIVFGYGQEP